MDKAMTIVAICRNVETFPGIEGLISRDLLLINKIAAPISMTISLLITRTVSQGGIMPITARTIYEVTRRSLSAMGSRYAPKMVFWLKSLAIRPSTASVMLAIIKVRKA